MRCVNHALLGWVPTNHFLHASHSNHKTPMKAKVNFHILVSYEAAIVNSISHLICLFGLSSESHPFVIAFMLWGRTQGYRRMRCQDAGEEYWDGDLVVQSALALGSNQKDIQGNDSIKHISKCLTNGAYWTTALEGTTNGLWKNSKAIYQQQTYGDKRSLVYGFAKQHMNNLILDHLSSTFSFLSTNI